ncbi:hypothetical protein Y032_0772g2227 [Ancylostoma ceylanicum]|uniref:Uncharacterized protein n=1 Tax=Ancylostoma ceylanicum TaxID=53326 RepID=A0A016WDK0_9BILA|nr:hypothetical protein Y032_0772g2227 [Ancylostoma ceylanicum]
MDISSTALTTRLAGGDNSACLLCRSGVRVCVSRGDGGESSLRRSAAPRSPPLLPLQDRYSLAAAAGVSYDVVHQMAPAHAALRSPTRPTHPCCCCRYDHILLLLER